LVLRSAGKRKAYKLMTGGETHEREKTYSRQMTPTNLKIRGRRRKQTPLFRRAPGIGSDPEPRSKESKIYLPFKDYKAGDRGVEVTL